MSESSRRDLLKLGLAGAAGGLLAGCAQLSRKLPGEELPASVELPRGDVHPTVRLLNRFGFGPRPGDVAAVQAMGHEAWFSSQIERKGGESLRLKSQLMRLDVLRIDGMELRDIPEDRMIEQFSQAILLRATYSGDQLFERLVDFWGNHFNIYARKGLASYRKARDEREVIRKHALGSFPEMLKASARSPAMLAYLDNQFNWKEAPNENYARELMELHSLGVDGGYTQRDVREVARCFTGWGIERRFLRPKGTFLFDPDQHDKGEKIVLGKTIPAGGGIEDGERVLDILAAHPATARHIAAKLCRHFIGTPTEGTLARVERSYAESNGSIRSMLTELFRSNEFVEGPPIVKRPLDFLVSSLRATGADSDAGAPLQTHLNAMGQPLYEWPSPDGYPDATEPWTGSLLARWNFAFALCSGAIDGTDVDLNGLVDRSESEDQATALAGMLLNASAPPSACVGQTVERGAALMLCSPEFQWR